MLFGPFGALLVFLHLALPGHADVVFTAEPCDRASFGLRPIQGDATRYKQCGPSGKVWIVPCAPHMSFDPVEKVCKEADEPKQNRKMEKARSRRPIITTPHPTAEEFVFSTVRPKRPRIKGKGKRIKTTTPRPTTMPSPLTTYVTEEPSPLMPQHPAPAFPPPGRATTVRPEYTVKYNGENMTEEELLRRLVDLVKAQKASAVREKQEKEERQRLEMERRRLEEERRIAQERAEMEERIRQEEERMEAERREIQRKEEERVRIREEKKKKEEERKKAMEKAEAARKKLEEEERMAAIEKKRREEELRMALEKAEYERMENERRIAEEMAERERMEVERLEQMKRIEEAKKEQERLERLRKEEKERKEREKEELMRRERERAERIRQEMERQLELERIEMERQMFNKYATTTTTPDFEIIRFPPTQRGSVIPPLPLTTTTTTSSPWVTSENSWKPPVDVYPSLVETTSEMGRTTGSPRVLDGCIPNGDCPFSYDGDHFCPHPENPALYLQCAPMIGRRGRWTTRRCPDGLLFSTHLGRCEKDPYSAYNPNQRVVIPRLPEENQHVTWTGNREIVTVTPVYVPQNKIYSTIDSFPQDLLPVVAPIHPQDLFKPKQAITEFDDYDILDLSKIHPIFPRVQPSFLNNFLPFQPLREGEKDQEEDNILGAVFKPFLKKVALKQTKNFLDRVLSDEELKRLEEKDRLRGEGTQ